MRTRAPTLPIAALLVLAHAEAARAGMPTVTLTDLARMRLQTISFFLLGLLACSWALRRIWNTLGSDFPRLPRMSFGRALGVVSLWGLLFVLILTMISGARELMTPGAWKKQGFTYTLADDAPPTPSDPGPIDEGRRRALDRLRVALWTFAAGHDGRFPTEDQRREIPDDAWLLPDPSGMRFLYVPGQVADEGRAPLAFEPGLFGDPRLVLLTDGRIVSMGPDEIARLAAGGPGP